MELRLTLTGMGSLLEAYSRAPAVVTGRLRVATKEALEMVQREARRSHRFHTRTGALERSVETASTGPASGVVFLNEAVAKHGAPIHDGSRPHVIAPRKRQVLRFAQGGAFRFAPMVNHPGTKPDQFLFRAADRMSPAVEMRYQQAVNESLEEVSL